MSFNHVVVWLDHHEAHVIHFNPEISETQRIVMKSSHTHLHQKSGVVGSGRLSPDPVFLSDIIKATSDAKEVLIVGPGSGKIDLIKYALKHSPKEAEKFVGVETVDHPTDGQLLGYAKKYFAAVDRLKGDSIF